MYLILLIKATWFSSSFTNLCLLISVNYIGQVFGINLKVV